MAKHVLGKVFIGISMIAMSGCNESGFTVTPKIVAPILPPPNSILCEQNPEAEACDRTPAVTTPGIVTVLFTVSQIPKEAATLILANAIKYASPAANPRILFLKDSNTHGEDEGDADYIKNELLLGYQVEYRTIMPGGLLPGEIGTKDLIVISNPGHPLTDSQTLTTLSAFSGGVILVGDDLAHGAGFSMEAFTGLTYRSNGTSLACGGNTYRYDNLGGYEYQIAMNSTFLPGIPDAFKAYGYGNDIDHTDPAANIQILATAKNAPNTCDITPIPVVVRKPR